MFEQCVIRHRFQFYKKKCWLKKFVAAGSRRASPVKLRCILVNSYTHKYILWGDSLVVTLRIARLNIKQDRQCKYKVKLKLYHLTLIAAEKQQVLHVMSDCLCSCFNCTSCKSHPFCADLYCHKNINSQLDATITHFIDNYNRFNMFREIISPILRSTRLCLQLMV